MVKVVLRFFKIIDKEHDVKKFLPMHERQKMEGMEPRFVTHRTITEDKFCGSTLDLLQGNEVFKEPGSPGLGTVNTVGSGPATGRDAGTKKVIEMRMSYIQMRWRE